MEQESSSPKTPLLRSSRTAAAASAAAAAHGGENTDNNNSSSNGEEALLAPMDTESVSSSHSHSSQQQQGSGSGGNNRNRRRRQISFYYRRTVHALAAVLADEQGTGWPVVFGLAVLATIGTILGSILPGDSDLPAGGYRFLSNAIGYTYFMSWSVSFYPQVISNYRRQSTLGLSPDFCGLNVIGFGFYMTYNVGLFWSPTIRKQYQERHGPDSSISVQSNDVAFAIHAFCLASITFFQIGYYNGFRGSQSPSKVIQLVAALFLGAAVIVPMLILTTHKLEWLDYLYMLGNIKVVITLMKYIPQVILNYRRQSTVGWSIWNIILDFAGGTLSDFQLVLDCASLNDWTGITGNLTKLALGSVSVIFDLIFMTQHYILYNNNPNNAGHNNNAQQQQQRLITAAVVDGDVNGGPTTDSSVQGEPLAAIDEWNL